MKTDVSFIISIDSSFEMLNNFLNTYYKMNLL